MKHNLLILLLVLQALSLSAQEKADTAFVFRFVPAKDTLYVPFKDNNPELERLCLLVKENLELIRVGKMYVSVGSYATLGSADYSVARMAYLRSSRVKSELITRCCLKEANFVTDRPNSEAYEGQRNVVVVVLPASVDKVARIAGEAAAQTVRRYYSELEQTANNAKNKEQVLAEQAAREAAEREAATRRANEERIAAENLRKAEAEKAAAAEQARLLAETKTQAKARTGSLALRANLLRWATLTPDLGIEWRINRHVGIMVNGSWTSWCWDDKNRKYALWEASSEFRYYMGKEKRGFLGAMYNIGQFNYKLNATGTQGDFQGGGITGGYQLPLNRSLSLDFSAGVGYTYAVYDKYIVDSGVRIRKGNGTKNYWGINQLGITLVWKIVK